MKKSIFILVLFLQFSCFAGISNFLKESSFDGRINNFTRTGNPEIDLLNFAKENDLDTNEARTILEKYFGVPEISQGEYFNKIARTGNPDKDLENFALSNNISKNEARKILVQMFGEPKKPTKH